MIYQSGCPGVSFVWSSKNSVAEYMLQARRMKGGLQALQAQKRMEATPFVL